LWRLKDITKDSVKLMNQANVGGDDAYYLVDGLEVKVVAIQQAGMKTWSIPSGSRKWTWDNAHGDLLGIGTGEPEGFGGAIGNAYDHWFSGGVPYTKIRTVLIKFAQTDTNGVVLNANDPNLSYAYRYLRNANAAQPARPEFAPYIINKSATYAYQDYVKKMPLAAYDIEANPPRRLMVGFVENNVAAGMVDGRYWPPDSRVASNVGSTGPREWLLIFDVPYSETPNPTLQVNPYLNATPMMWFCTPARQGNVAFDAADQFLISRWYPFTTLQTFSFTVPTNTIRDATLSRDDVNQINVFPNPYYAVNPQELKMAEKFVTFTHLPPKAIVRIFNLGGVMVRRLDKDTPSQFLRWDLKNEFGLPVGSGLYIAYIEMPELGVTKTLKLAIVQEQQVIE
jgi:hypothetical protein